MKLWLSSCNLKSNEYIYDKAAAYLYHIVKNHPFNDGNKRTGAGTALMFLRSNGVDPKYDNDEYVQLVVDVAEGKVDKSEISQFFQECSI